MPECYTNVNIAMHALMRGGHMVASQPAFIAGANGPAPLFMYKIWKRRRKPDLPELAAKMHRKKTGDFLVEVVKNAMTPIQQSYAMGFVTSYTTACTLNPYIEAMSSKGFPYYMQGGRWRMATALDSALYYTDYKTRLVPLHAGTPVLITDNLAQVCTLLRDSIARVYGANIPLLALADAFHDNMWMRGMMITPSGLKKPLVRLLQPKNPDRYGGAFTYRTQPAKKMKRLPEKWKNPHTGDAMDLTLSEVLALTEQTGAAAMTASISYWLGVLDEQGLRDVLGSNDYYTGQRCKEEAGEVDDGKAEQPKDQRPLKEDAEGEPPVEVQPGEKSEEK